MTLTTWLRTLSELAGSLRFLYPSHGMRHALKAAAGYFSGSGPLPSRGAGCVHTSSAYRCCSRAKRIATDPSLSAETDKGMPIPRARRFTGFPRPRPARHEGVCEAAPQHRPAGVR